MKNKNFEENLRVQIGFSEWYAPENYPDSDMITIGLWVSAAARRKPLLLKFAGIALPYGHVLPLEGPAVNEGIISSGPEFPHWLTLERECSFHIDYHKLSVAVLALRYEGPVALTALFSDMAGETYHSGPLTFDPAQSYRRRIPEEGMKRARDFQRRLAEQEGIIL